MKQNQLLREEIHHQKILYKKMKFKGILEYRRIMIVQYNERIILKIKYMLFAIKKAR